MYADGIQFTRIEIRIAKHIFRHYKDRLNARQLARILGINHAHVNKLCKLLVEKRLILKEDIGNSTFFSYRYDDRLAIKFMEYLLSLEKKEFPAWLAVVAHSLEKFDGLVEMGVVFGSSIRTKGFNDIDVLLVYNPRKAGGIKKIKGEIRKSGLVDKPIRYVDLAEKDIFLNRESKVFYNMLAESLVFNNAEKYVGVIKKCRR